MRRWFGQQPSMSPEDERARYLAALGVAQHDYEMAWLVFGSVFVGQTVLLGFIGFALSSSSQPSRWTLEAAALLGILLWVPWFTTFQRNTGMHAFRVHLAASIEPAGWNILRGLGKLYADDKQVVIDHPDGTRECFQRPKLGRWRTKHATSFLQAVVLAAYLVILATAVAGKIGS